MVGQDGSYSENLLKDVFINIKDVFINIVDEQGKVSDGLLEPLNDAIASR